MESSFDIWFCCIPLRGDEKYYIALIKSMSKIREKIILWYVYCYEKFKYLFDFSRHLFQYLSTSYWKVKRGAIVDVLLIWILWLIRKIKCSNMLFSTATSKTQKYLTIYSSVSTSFTKTFTVVISISNVFTSI